MRPTCDNRALQHKRVGHALGFALERRELNGLGKCTRGKQWPAHFKNSGPHPDRTRTTGIYTEYIYLTSLNYDTGQISTLGDKNTIIEALKIQDINNTKNNNLISIKGHDNLVKFRQFY